MNSSVILQVVVQSASSTFISPLPTHTHRKKTYQTTYATECYEKNSVSH
jgi:hypothetical protein